MQYASNECSRRRRRFWHATQDCVAPYVDIILHRGWLSGGVVSDRVGRCWAMWCGDVLVVFSSLPEGRLTGSSWHLRCHPRAQYAQTDLVSRRDWIRAVSLGCFVSLQSIHHHSVQLGTIWCQAAYADTTGWTHRSYMRSSLTSHSSPNHTGILVRCTCCTASTSLR